MAVERIYCNRIASLITGWSEADQVGAILRRGLGQVAQLPVVGPPV